ncbi:DUF4209 domain-containing protein [Chryseobacterium gambrini]|uniref:DUF4209 domain-containing protein n=1 Tax=Chryseobacterium gambrini TaxID=373672 RepID=UPI0025B5EFF1|nr:DUF4209 domain-containing protein [Chryseobacterium gambrini]MDN4029816.1 DUF4209 domain-containing protein [Chryseobacterium gambrini]
MQFTNLESYYTYLEEDENFSVHDFNTTKYLKILGDSSSEAELKKLYSYEQFFCDFSIKKGEHVPQYQMGDYKYPTLELFDDDFVYLKKRAEETINPKYKSRYNHILWLSPQKHYNYAKQAIESYMTLLENSNFAADDNLLNNSFRTYFENLFLLSQSINYKTAETIDYFTTLLAGSKISEFCKYAIIRFIVENIKKNDAVLFEKFFDYANSQLEIAEDRLLGSFLKLLIIISQKLKKSPAIFHEKLGDWHISQLKKENEQSFVAHHFYLNALEEYRKANHKEKIEQTSVLLEQAKKTINLKRVPLEIKDEKILEALNQYWKMTVDIIKRIVTEKSSKYIYEYLIVEDFLPKPNSEEDEPKSALSDLVTTMTFDINRNVNKNKSGMINLYHLHINNFTFPQISRVFLEGMKEGKITFESLTDYMKNFTWYGTDFTYVDNNNEKQGFDWIELLTPSLQVFFNQIETDIKTVTNHHQGYIVAIDSLVLKFEGLLREFSRAIAAQTIEFKADGTEERISFDRLLDNKKITDLIPANDIAFFKYLFTSEGMNLRNNIAHCFYKTENYSSSTMLLLIVALLRLGNYRLEQTHDK